MCNDCVICLEPMRPEIYRTLINCCKNEFHTTCLHKSLFYQLASTGNISCPLCRNPINEEVLSKHFVKYFYKKNYKLLKNYFSKIAHIKEKENQIYEFNKLLKSLNKNNFYNIHKYKSNSISLILINFNDIYIKVRLFDQKSIKKIKIYI